MMLLTHLTDDELIRMLSLRTDLTVTEAELLDRLVRAREAIEDMEKDLARKPCRSPV